MMHYTTTPDFDLAGLLAERTSVHLSDLYYRAAEAEDGEYVLWDFCAGSDQSPTFALANYRSATEHVYACKHCYVGENVWRVTGDYGSFGCLTGPGACDWWQGTADACEDYPVVSDDVLGEVETELREESWDSWGRSDARHALEDCFGEDFADALSDNDIDAIHALWEDTLPEPSWSPWTIDGNGSTAYTEDEFAADLLRGFSFLTA